MAKTCLIAEHDPWDIQLLRLFVESLGFTIAQAYETQDVVPIAKDVKPDVILLEADLPGTIGCQEVVHNLRSDPTVDKTAIVLLLQHAEGPAPYADAAIQCLEKPATYEGLRVSLEQLSV